MGALETFLTIIKEAGDKGFPPGTFLTLATLGSLLVQGIYLLARPKWEYVWSRIGFVFAILMLVLGPAVWEGLQAVPRVLLPMTIAFNILFSRKLFFIPILVFANTLTFVGISSFEPKLIEERFEMVDQSNLAYDPSTNRYSYLEFTNGWSINEGKKSRYWRWSQGDSVAEFFNPRDQSIEVEFSFTPKTISPRDIILEVNGGTSGKRRTSNFTGMSTRSHSSLFPGKTASGSIVRLLPKKSETIPDLSALPSLTTNFALSERFQKATSLKHLWIHSAGPQLPQALSIVSFR